MENMTLEQALRAEAKRHDERLDALAACALRIAVGEDYHAEDDHVEAAEISRVREWILDAAKANADGERESPWGEGYMAALDDLERHLDGKPLRKVLEKQPWME